MSMLDDAHAALIAATSADFALRTALAATAVSWVAEIASLCPDLPDCDHDTEGTEGSGHVMTVAAYEHAEEILELVNRGKICCKCDRRIVLPQLPRNAPERCIHHKEPG